MKKKCFYTIIIIVVFSLLNIYLSNHWIKITRETHVSSDLPEAFDGYKILQITDLHANNSKEMNLDIWSVIAKEDFDIVVITGDIIDSHNEGIKPHLSALKSLANEKPVYFVDGNHEHWDNYYNFKKLLQSHGVIVFDNDKTIISKDNSTINILGVTDYSLTDYTPIYSTIDTIKPAEYALLLSHEPYIIDKIDNTKIDLIITGHVHGGQIRLPFLPTLYAPGRRFLPEYGYGWYEKKSTQMYLSSGLGYTGALPFRFFNRPELTIIELKSNLTNSKENEK